MVSAARPPSVPVQLAIPVAPGTPVGTTVYFYRAGQFLDANGITTQAIWWQVETGTVGADGMAHTHSPPAIGAKNSGLYLFGYKPGGPGHLRSGARQQRPQPSGAEAGQVELSIAINGRPTAR